MTIPVSTVPSAIAALTAQITTAIATDTAPSPIAIYTGEEGASLANDRIIVATNVRRRVKPEVFMGGYQQGSLLEDYDIDCLVSSYSGDPDPIANMERAWVLVGYIETAVRTDPSLGTSVLEAHPAGADGGQSYVTDSPTGRQCDITVIVSVQTLN